MSLKTTKIFDLNLISGSSELIRQAVGGVFYDVGTGEIDFDGAEISVEDGVRPNQIESVDFASIDKSTDKILPRIKYANRLYSDLGYEFLSDDDWKTFIIGGTYADIEYSGIYNQAVYADHANTSSLPYLPREIVNVTSESPSLTLTTEYFKYYPRYQIETLNQDSELTIPNYYLLSSSILLGHENVESSVAVFTYPRLENYLTATYVNEIKTIDTSKENLIIPNPTGFNSSLSFLNALSPNTYLAGRVDSDLTRLFSRMPFGNKLIIEKELAESNDDFRDIIEANDYTIKFLKLLKETFQGENGLPTTTVNFAVNTNSVSSTGILTGSQQVTTTVPFQVVDMPTMLLYAYKNPMSETNNIHFITGSADYSSEVNYAMDMDGVYRHENTNRTVSLLNSVTDKILEKFDTVAGGPLHPLQNFLDQANEDKYHETVAFRIQKIGGQPTGDSRTQNTIQNIWFYNVNTIIEYFDTQVKYDTEYTYKIFKYDIVQGYKYQLSDVVTTRQIATTSLEDNRVYCLEFYDPFSGQASNPLLEENRTTSELVALSGSLETERLTTEGSIVSILSRLNADKNTIINNYYKLGGRGAPVRSDGTPLDPQFFGKFKAFYEGIFGPETSPPKPLEDTSSYSYFENIKNYVDSRLSGDIGDESEIEIIAQSFEDVLIEANNKGAVAETLEVIRTTVSDFIGRVLIDFTSHDDMIETQLARILRELREVQAKLDVEISSLRTNAQINTSYPYLSDFNITIEPSLKIIEIPLEEKSMRIVDHPPNDFVITPHHLLDQSNRLAFYCKYDTFSQNAVTYPPVLTTLDSQNKVSYMQGNDFVEVSTQTQESVSSARFIEVYRTTTKPTSYDDFAGKLRKTIDLRQENGDVASDNLFVERVRENTIYYYAFRSVNDNAVAGQMSPVFEAELINDGGYTYGRFVQYSEDDLTVPIPQEPILSIKKLFNIVPNAQHLEIDISNASLAGTSNSQIDSVNLGSSIVDDPLFSSDEDRYFKIRLTSKKTGKKLDINIGFKKEVRK